jgi:hypothetical protein
MLAANVGVVQAAPLPVKSVVLKAVATAVPNVRQ